MPWVLSIRLQGSDSQMLREINHGKLVKRRSLFFETRTANQAGSNPTSDVKKQETAPSESEGLSHLPGQEQAPVSSGVGSRWVSALCLFQLWNTGAGRPGLLDTSQPQTLHQPAPHRAVSKSCLLLDTRSKAQEPIAASSPKDSTYLQQFSQASTSGFTKLNPDGACSLNLYDNSQITCQVRELSKQHQDH